MKVPQFIPWVGSDEFSAMKDCFDRVWITEGPKAKDFCRRLCDLIGVKYGVFAPNGTLALYLALRGMGIGPGDEVLVPDFTFIASANSVQMTGAIPVFVDVDPVHLQMDASQIEALVTPQTKAIMPCHILGTICPMEDMITIAQKHNLKIIEDAAQAIGVHRKGKHAGSFGTVAAFSFFADKAITTAEGGFVATDDEAIYRNLKFLRNQGRENRGSFIHPEMGYNFRMTDLQCAIGLSQLAKFEIIQKRKLQILEKYRSVLDGVKAVRFFQPPDGSEWLPFRVGILCERAHELMDFMGEREIEPRSFFYPLHRQPCYAYLRDHPVWGKRMDDSHFPHAVSAYNHGICLPTYIDITDEQIEFVGQTIRDFYEKK